MADHIYTRGTCTLIQGDMRAVLPGLAEKAALICTDPPYLLTTGGNTTGEMRGCFARDEYDNSGAWFPVVPWDKLAPVLFAVARKDADVIVMANDRNLCEAETALRGAGFKFHRTLVWDKGSVTPNRWFMQGLEFAFYGYKGRARPIADKASHPLFKVRQIDETDHPNEKPVAMLQRWIELTTDPGDLVIDPFMGSGSTAVAALRAGRRFVGVELLPRWFGVACTRIDRAVETLQSVFTFGDAP